MTNVADNTPVPNEPIKLKKRLGLLNGVGIITGVIIGSGIFVSPIGVLQASGSVGLSLVIWFVCGMLAMCGALCYAELGTMIPKSGGEFAYLKESFGSIFAFLYLWAALIIIIPTGHAIIALTFAEYILQPFYINCAPPESAIRLLATLVVMLLTFINCYSVKLATIIQDTLAFCKIIALIIIIIAGCIHLGKGHSQGLKDSFNETTSDIPSIALAFYSGMFSFSGWNYLNFVTEELKHPMRDLPRAIFISLPLVTLIYLLTNIAYFVVLSREEILSSFAVAGTFGDKVLGVMAWIIPVFVALSTFGGLNGGIFSTGRLFFVGAREGHLPSVVAMITIKYLTPAPSLIFLGILTIFYLFTGHILFLINLTSFVEALFLTITVGSLLWMRFKDPDKHRPIRVNLIFPVLFLTIGIILVVVPFFEAPEDVGFGIVLTLAGVPLFWFFVHRKQKPKFFQYISKTHLAEAMEITETADLNDGIHETEEYKISVEDITQRLKNLSIEDKNENPQRTKKGKRIKRKTTEAKLNDQMQLMEIEYSKSPTPTQIVQGIAKLHISKPPTSDFTLKLPNCEERTTNISVFYSKFRLFVKRIKIWEEHLKTGPVLKHLSMRIHYQEMKHLKNC